MVSRPPPRLTAADREDISDAVLLTGGIRANLVAAVAGDETADALRNAERQAEQVLSTVRRVRERLLGP